MLIRADVLAHGDMGIRGWMIGPILTYLIAWGISVLLVPTSAVIIANLEESKPSKIINFLIWAFYAVPIILLVMAYCHFVSFDYSLTSSSLGLVLAVFALSRRSWQ